MKIKPDQIDYWRGFTLGTFLLDILPKVTEKELETFYIYVDHNVMPFSIMVDFGKTLIEKRGGKNVQRQKHN